MNDDRIPVWSPLLALLKSRKVMVALVTLIGNLIIALLPQLEPIQNELMAVLLALGTVLMGAIAYEDTH